ncbi:MAG: hypothetical protein JXA33_12330 [Anaerolineae bacterium]|nr:hypothetical protein [Anaerolineae bacterium]
MWYKAEAVVKQSGTLVLEHLPFQVGDCVEVIVTRVSKLPQPSVVEAYPLRGTVLRYDDPFAPVAESDWEILQ